ncbi:prepilin peptidase [Aeromicrobium phragmitis]|uniref:Prepilin peptidase n=1 Tax=Aeromicrobium phragmitis TaxID=2478914 RepID=A0A3L8PL22_9ACTN|nr:A24 family peptidase [Aeromicrobium phragmitis]RLV55413.1 prepilin peptidase [Aeromicrobium phragmitis]
MPPAASLAVVVAAVFAALTRWWLARLPEPDEPDEDKVAYAQLAQPPFLALACAVAGAVLAACAVWQLPEPLVPVWTLLAAMTPVLAYVDARTHLLPFLMVAPLYVGTWLLTLAVAWAGDDWSIARDALVGNVAVFATFVLLYVVAGRFFAGGFGYGDVRLSAVLGVALGPLGLTASFVGLYAGFVIAAVVGIVRNRGRVRGGPPIAFGPAMLLGAFVGTFV